MQNEQTHTLQKSSVIYHNFTLVCDAIAAETSRTHGLLSLSGHVIKIVSRFTNTDTYSLEIPRKL